MLLAQQDHTMLLILAAFLVLAVFVVFLVVFLTVFRPWLQAFLSGAPVSVLNIVGMRLRRTNPSVIINTLIMARQAGVDITSRQVEQAYLQGVDLEKVTLALISARKQKMSLTFDDLVDAELDGRLADKLDRPTQM